jgi:hypothetical protein
MPRKKKTWKDKEEVVTGLGGGPEGYAGWKVVEEGRRIVREAKAHPRL